MRKSGKMALYEAIGHSQGSLYDKKQPKHVGHGGPEREPEPHYNEKWSVVLRLGTPHIVLATIGLLLLLALSFKMGQSNGKKIALAQGTEPVTTGEVDNGGDESDDLFGDMRVIEPDSEERADRTLPGVQPDVTEPAEPESGTGTVEPTPQPVEPVSTGEYVIVMATLDSKRNFEPVIEYYRSNGIELTVRTRGSKYQLVTKNRVNSPYKVGTDGYELLKKIQNIGKNYKAPSGYGDFTSKFSDAYGDKN